MRLKLSFLRLAAASASVALVSAAFASGPVRVTGPMQKAKVTADQRVTFTGDFDADFAASLPAPTDGKSGVSSLTPGWFDAGRAVGDNLRRIDLTFNTGNLAGSSLSGHAFRPALSSDGDFVAFTSLASNILPGDTNGFADVFRYQISTGTFRLVSGGDGASGFAAFEHGTGEEFAMWSNAISNGGGFVAFTSESTDLVAGDTNALPDVFRANMSGVTPTYLRASVSSAGAEDNQSRSIDAAMSDDGNEIAFASRNDFGNASDTNFVQGGFDVFHKNMTTNALTLVSHEASGVNVSGTNTPDSWIGAFVHSRRPSMTANGAFIAYDSTNPRIATPTRTVMTTACYVWDRGANTNSLMVVNSDGSANNINAVANTFFNAQTRHAGYNASISPDGTWVAFQSSVNLIVGSGQVDGNGQVYVRQRTTPGSIRWANSDVAGVRVNPGNGTTFRGVPCATVDNNGNVAFWTHTQISALDTQTFIQDGYFKSFDAAAPAATGALTLITRSTGGNVGERGHRNFGDGAFHGSMDKIQIGPGAAFFVYTSSADNLDPAGATFGLRNIFKADVNGSFAVTNLTKLTVGDAAIDSTISWDDSVGSVGVFLHKPSVSANGQWVGYGSKASNMFSPAFLTTAGQFYDQNVLGINLSSGQVVMGDRNSDGTMSQTLSITAFFSLDFFSASGGLGDLQADSAPVQFGGATATIVDPYSLYSHGLMGFGAGVNDSGGLSVFTFDAWDAAAVNGLFRAIWSPTAAGATSEIIGEVSGTSVDLNGIFFSGSRTWMTGNGRFVFFNSDGIGVTSDSFSTVATPVTSAYRYDTTTDDILLASVGRLGFANDGDCLMTDHSLDGSQLTFYNILASNIGDSGELADNDQVWVRNLGTGITRCLTTNAAGDRSTTSDPLGLTSGFTGASALSDDGSAFTFDSNADNLVAGVSGVGGAQVYLKTVNGAQPHDMGAIRCVSVSNVDTLPVDTGGGEFAQRPDISPSGTHVVFESDAADLTAVDTNGAQVDAFIAELNGATLEPLRLASLNSADDQSVPGSALFANVWTISGGSIFTLFVLDGGDMPADRSGALLHGGSSSVRSLWLKFFQVGASAADSSWALFE